MAWPYFHRPGSISLLAACALLAAGIALMLSSYNAAAESRYALIITNQDYPTTVGQLTHTHEDGRILADVLERLKFVVRWVRDADKATIMAAVAEQVGNLAESKGQAVGFLYYSGHGAAAEKFGENYLLPVAAPISSAAQLPLLGVKLGDIVEAYTAAGAKANFIVLDACRNVPFSAGTRAATRGLVPVREQSGLLIAFSTDPGNVAVDDNIYSRALAEEMLSPGIEAVQMFRSVRRKVLAGFQLILVCAKWDRVTAAPAQYTPIAEMDGSEHTLKQMAGGRL